MTHMPPKLRREINADPFYRYCARRGLHGHVCGGRITREHALIFAHRQIQKKHAIVPLCAKAHAVDEYQDGGDMNKEINVWIALSRATTAELLEISKAVDYFRLLRYLNGKYGIFELSTFPPGSYTGINYGPAFLMYE